MRKKRHNMSDIKTYPLKKNSISQTQWVTSGWVTTHIYFLFSELFSHSFIIWVSVWLIICLVTSLSPSDSPVSPQSWADQRHREVKEWGPVKAAPDQSWWTDGWAGDAANHSNKPHLMSTSCLHKNKRGHRASKCDSFMQVHAGIETATGNALN